jgi:TRAP-type C4-dicarboxylate transport system permease small subunit
MGGRDVKEEGGVIRSTARILSAIERVYVSIAAVFMAVVMFVVVGDVFFRYVLNSPFSWANDLIGLYLMAGIFFLVLSPAYAERAHVGVDIVYQVMPRRVQLAADVVTNVTGTAFFAVIAKIGYDRFISAFLSGDVIAGSIPWPTWASYVLVPIGAGMLALRMALHLIADCVALATGARFAFLEEAEGHSPEGMN